MGRLFGGYLLSLPCIFVPSVKETLETGEGLNDSLTLIFISFPGDVIFLLIIHERRRGYLI